MIKINLLPQKRPKRHAQRTARDPSSNHVVIGIAALVGLGAVVFFLVDKPRRDELAELRGRDDELRKEIAAKQLELAGTGGEKSYAELKTAEKDAKERAQSINRLNAARVIPAHVLHELGRILTPREIPTMTEDMARKTGNGPDGDSNKRFQLDWDPTHLWLSGFSDVGGSFRIEGGAQDESDVTQLSKRLAASVYFSAPSFGTERVVDRETGLNYYKFVITGKVVY